MIEKLAMDLGNKRKGMDDSDNSDDEIRKRKELKGGDSSDHSSESEGLRDSRLYIDEHVKDAKDGNLSDSSSSSTSTFTPMEEGN